MKTEAPQNLLPGRNQEELVLTFAGKTDDCFKGAKAWENSLALVLPM
jgi:hypothetical protein